MSTLLDQVAPGATDVSVSIRIIDSTDGSVETGVVYNTAGISLWYRRQGGLRVALTLADLATPALDDPHLEGGFLHISDGEYRLDALDACFVAGVEHVDFGGTVPGMVVIGGRVKIDDGSGFSALGDMSATMKAAVQSAVEDALVAKKVDQIAGAAATSIVDNSGLAKIASPTGVFSVLVPSEASLQAVYNNSVAPPANFAIMNIDANGNVIVSGVGRANVILSTTIDVVTSRTSFTIAAGNANIAAGMIARIQDSADKNLIAEISIATYTHGTLTITLDDDPGAITTLSNGDFIDIIDNSVMTSADAASIYSYFTASNRADAFKAAAIVAQALVTARVRGTTVKAYVNEQVTFTIAPVDDDGVAVDTTGMTLQIVIERKDGTDVETIADGAITKTATSFSFTPDATTNANVNQFDWSCRRTDTDEVIAYGKYVVDYAADD